MIGTSAKCSLSLGYRRWIAFYGKLIKYTAISDRAVEQVCRTYVNFSDPRLTNGQPSPSSDVRVLIIWRLDCFNGLVHPEGYIYMYIYSTWHYYGQSEPCFCRDPDMFGSGIEWWMGQPIAWQGARWRHRAEVGDWLPSKSDVTARRSVTGCRRMTSQRRSVIGCPLRVTSTERRSVIGCRRVTSQWRSVIGCPLRVSTN